MRTMTTATLATQRRSMRANTATASNAELPWLLLGGTVLVAGVAARFLGTTAALAALAVPLVPLLVLAPQHALLLVIAAIPFDAVAALGDARTLSVTRLLGTAVLGGWVLHAIVFRRRLQLEAPARWLLAYVAFAGVSIYWADNRDAAIASWTTLVQLFGLYLMASQVLTGPRALGRALDTLVVATLVLSLLVLWQLPQLGPLARATLRYGDQTYNANYLAATLVFPSVAALGLGRGASGWRLLALVPIVVATVTTGSRGGGAALLTGLLVAAAVRPRLGTRAVGIVLLLAVAAPLVASSPYVERMWQRFGAASEDRLSGRLDIWKVGAAVVADHPLAGTGLAGFPEAFNQYVLHANVDPRWALEHVEGHRVAHNVYLGAAAELGVVGGVLLLGALLAHGRRAWRAARRVAAGPGPALLGIFASLAVFGTTIDLLTMKLTWLLLAMMHALPRATAGRSA